MAEFRMRTTEEILDRVAYYGNTGNDWLGCIRSDLLEFVTPKAAAKFLKPDSAPWEPKEPTRELLIALIKDYLPFAWEKANNCRGLSAGRSLNHMEAWLWLLGHEHPEGVLKDYTFYGKPQLVWISELPPIDFPWREHDSNTWRTWEDAPGRTAKQVLGR